MTDKERLEEIKEEVESLRGDMSVYSIETETSADIILDDMEWLIEQSERAQELEEIIYQDERQAILEGLYEENKHYREALEFINEELELVLHSNKGLAEKMFYIENSKRKITEVLEGESNEQRTTGRIKKDEVIV